jgi:hypothetical protein
MSLAKLDTIKVVTTNAKAQTEDVIGPNPASPEDPAQEVLGQQKRRETGQFCLQVDRQTKASYATYEAAEQAALVIKKGFPVVRVAIYDTIERVNKVIEIPR